MAYESITVENMSPACGAIITGVDLAGGVSNQQFDEIHTALLDRTVIIFRDQVLTETQHIEFTRRFGDLQPAAVSGFEKNADYPEIDILEYDDSNPPHVTRDLWHTDFVGRERPSMGTSLYARNIPPEGGDTIWVNSGAAYEGLSDRMKTHLEGLHAYNDAYQPYDEHVRPELWAKDYQIYKRQQKAEYTPALHPVIRTHPETGQKGLFVNESMTSFIKEISRRESNYLLQYLFDHLRTPEFQYRHKWRVNDLAVWDNRLSLHYALFDYTKNRLMHRVVIAGDVPH
ncbi:MAG: taurine dioxygenase [Rhodospirillaceae bacterium]|nr:taurine dioxygenase [Rhodospirillaceae bacterium]|tara:strand:+ start:316 stop:1173 length:858 start_codon:yes stop_codon:yes gene_type:complete